MDLEHEHRLTEVEARSKSNTKRLDEVEVRQNNLDKLVTSVEVLATKQETVETDVKESPAGSNNVKYNTYCVRDLCI